MNFFYNYIRKKLISQSCQPFSAAYAGLGCGCSSISRDAQSYRTSPQPPAPAPLGLHWYLLLVRHVPNTSPRSCPCRATSSGFLCCGGETGPTPHKCVPIHLLEEPHFCHLYALSYSVTTESLCLLMGVVTYIDW